jgi:hypothetical protein
MAATEVSSVSAWIRRRILRGTAQTPAGPRAIAGFEDIVFSELPLRPPGPPSRVTAFREFAGDRLPGDFLNFYSACDGGEGRLGENWLNLWSIADMPERNRAYRIDRFAPGLVIFGCNGAHFAYAFDLRGETPKYVSIPWVPMELTAVDEIAETFRGFLIEMQLGWLPSQ